MTTLIATASRSRDPSMQRLGRQAQELMRENTELRAENARLTRELAEARDRILVLERDGRLMRGGR